MVGHHHTQVIMQSHDLYNHMSYHTHNVIYKVIIIINKRIVTVHLTLYLLHE